MNFLEYIESIKKLDKFDERNTSWLLLQITKGFFSEVSKLYKQKGSKEDLNARLGSSIFGDDYRQKNYDFFTSSSIGRNLRYYNIDSTIAAGVNYALDRDLAEYGLNNVHRKKIQTKFIASLMQFIQKDPMIASYGLKTFGLSRAGMLNFVENSLKIDDLKAKPSDKNYVERINIALRFRALKKEISDTRDINKLYEFRIMTHNEQKLVRAILTIQKELPAQLVSFLDDIIKAVPENKSDQFIKIRNIFKDIEKNNKISQKNISQVLHLFPNKYIRDIALSLRTTRNPLINILKGVILRTPVNLTNAFVASASLNSMLRAYYGNNYGIGIISSYLDYDVRKEMGKTLRLLKGHQNEIFSVEEKYQNQFISRNFANSKALLKKTTEKLQSMFEIKMFVQNPKLKNVLDKMTVLKKDINKDEMLFENWETFNDIAKEVGDLIRTTKKDRKNSGFINRLKVVEKFVADKMAENDTVIENVYMSSDFKKAINGGILSRLYSIEQKEAEELEKAKKRKKEEQLKKEEKSKKDDPYLDNFMCAGDVGELFSSLKIDVKQLPILKQFEKLPLEIFGIQQFEMQYIDGIIQRYNNNKVLLDMQVLPKPNNSAFKNALVDFLITIPNHKPLLIKLKNLVAELSENSRTMEDLYYGDIFKNPDKVFENLDAYAKFDEVEKDNLVKFLKFIDSNIEMTKDVLKFVQDHLENTKLCKKEDSAQLRTTLQSIYEIVDGMTSLDDNKRIPIGKPLTHVLLQATFKLPSKTRVELLESIKNIFGLKGLSATSIDALKSDTIAKSLYYTNILNFVMKQYKIIEPLMNSQIDYMIDAVEKHSIHRTKENDRKNEKVNDNKEKGSEEFNHYFVDALILSDSVNGSTYKNLSKIIDNSVNIGIDELFSDDASGDKQSLWKLLVDSTKKQPYIKTTLSNLGIDCVLDKMMVDKNFVGNTAYKIIANKENYDVFSNIALNVGSKSISFINNSSYRKFFADIIQIEAPSMEEKMLMNKERAKKYKILNDLKTEIEKYVNVDGNYSLTKLYELFESSEHFDKNIKSAKLLSKNNESIYNVLEGQLNKVTNAVQENQPAFNKNNIFKFMKYLSENSDKQELPNYVSDYIANKIAAPKFKNFSELIVKDIVLFPITNVVSEGVKELKKENRAMMMNNEGWKSQRILINSFKKEPHNFHYKGSF